MQYSPRATNASKAMNNWERKSKYLLREIVKFRTYIDSLELAAKAKKEVLARRAEREADKARLFDSREKSGGGHDGYGENTPTKAEYTVDLKGKERDLTPRAAQFFPT